MKNLTLIIPAKNEKESLPYVLDEIKNLDCKKKVLLASDDLETIDAIKNLDVEIVYQDNRGFGDALISGINSVDTDYFCIFNADGSFDPSELTNMMLLIKESNSDFIFASRYQDNSGSKDDTIITLIGNTIFTLLGKIFFIEINVIWSRGKDYYTSAEWRGTKKLDGGTLLNQASHYVDLMFWLFGKPVLTQSLRTKLKADIETEDTFSANLLLENNIHCSFNATTTAYEKISRVRY